MSNGKILLVYKPSGLTPIQIVAKVKEKYSEYAGSKISYAGRLDPMAHGLVVLLIDEENKKREQYLHLDKTYIVEILFGFQTDTYDVLGRVSKVSRALQVSQEYIEKELQKFVGKKEQVYPPYSSKAVLGKPLFWWARNEKLSEIEIPKHSVEIYSIDFLSERKISGKELGETIKTKIEKVSGNFRQEHILDDWQKSIDQNYAYTSIKISVVCSSGTYMRSLVDELGKNLGYGAIALDIFRTKVGEFLVENTERI